MLLQVALDCPHSVPRMHLQASASLPCRCLLSCSIQVAWMPLKRIQHILTASSQGIPPSSLAIHTLRLRAQSKAQGEGTKPRHKQSMSSAMQPNKLAISRASPPRFMLVSDLDHTMVQHGDPMHTHLLAFNRLWHSRFAHESILCYSTGRSPALYRELWDASPLLTPSVLLCSVGTELYWLAQKDASGKLCYVPDEGWQAVLDIGWDAAALQALVQAEFTSLQPQVSSEQRHHKLSYHLSPAGRPQAAAAEEMDRLRQRIQQLGLRAKVIYSGGVDVDVLAAGAGKGKALEYVLSQLRDKGMYPAQGVQVNGDSGNDAELLDVPGVKGCVVSNAHAELKEYAVQHQASGHVFMASLPCAAGIIQALHHFHFMPQTAGHPTTTTSTQHTHTTNHSTAPGGGISAPLEAWQAGVDCVYAALGGPDEPCYASVYGVDKQGPDVSLGADGAGNISHAPVAGTEGGGGAAASIWLDEVLVRAAGADCGSDSEPTFSMSCKVYSLSAEGKRDPGAVSTIKLVIHPAQPDTGNDSEDVETSPPAHADQPKDHVTGTQSSIPPSGSTPSKDAVANGSCPEAVPLGEANDPQVSTSSAAIGGRGDKISPAGVHGMAAVVWFEARVVGGDLCAVADAPLPPLHA